MGTIEALAPLITSKARLKLLTRFFLNLSIDGYLHGLSMGLDENINRIRLKLSRIEKAGLFASKTKDCRKLYGVNTAHSLTSVLTSIAHKVSVIDALVERVNVNPPSLEQFWVSDNLAKGLPSEYIEPIIVGADLDRKYIKLLNYRTQSLMGKTIRVNSLGVR